MANYSKANYSKLGRYGFYGLVILIAFALFDYWTPNGAVGRIGGTEVKRMDARGDGRTTRDVRYITMELRGSRQTRIFANEDSALYFLKLDSATIQGRAQNLATRSEPAFALVRYYGWRIPLLSMFPNALSVEEVPADYRYTPWGRIVVAVVILALLFEVTRRYRRWKRRRAAQREERAARERQLRAQREVENNRDILHDFINGGGDSAKK
jgi:hypothetical protein